MVFGEPPACSTAVSIRSRTRTAGIGTRTLLLWLKIPEFAAVSRESRREAFGQSIAQLQQATSAAAATFMKIMVDPSAPASVRVRAAESIFNHSARAIEIEDIEARVSELERAGNCKAAYSEVNTRSLAARLKRLEFRPAPDYQPPAFEIFAPGRVAMVGLDLRDRAGEKIKDGRHVGLDFYDLLIEPIFTNNAPERFEFWSLGFLQRFSLVLLFSKADLAAGLLKHLPGAVSER